MNEQTNQNTDLGNQAVEDDPLAELARIVAGEPELGGDAMQFPSEPEVSSETFAAPNSPQDMEAVLEEHLLQELSAKDLEIETPEFVDDINSTIEEITKTDAVAEQKEPSLEAITESFDEIVEEASPESVGISKNTISEADFQDDLISALEGELVGEEAVPEPQLQSEPEPELLQEPEVAPVVNETVVSEDDIVSSLESELQAASLEATEVEPVFVEEAPVEEPTTFEQSLEEELTASLAEVDELDVPHMDQQVEVELPVLAEEVTEFEQPIEASLEDDLGAAFANEFEQMNAQYEGIEANDQVAELVVDLEEPAIEEPVQVQEPTEEIVGNIDLEMDFEAAFAEELDIADPVAAAVIPASADKPADNVVSFGESSAEMQTPIDVNMQNLEQDLATVSFEDENFNDPGHVGSVDEISSVEAANDESASKGGGLKYAAAALILALFAGTIATGYGFLGGDNQTIASGTPNIIKADAEPFKVKPDDPGGIVPENQNNASYTDLGGENNVEVSQKELVSTTEEPASLNTQVADLQPKSDDRLSSSEDIGATPNSSTSSVLPKIVETLVVKPDGTILSNPVKPKAVETVSNTLTNLNTPSITANPISTPAIAKPEGIDGAVTTGNLDIPTASPLPKPVIKPKPSPVKRVAVAKPKPAAPAPVARKSEWVVQVSSQRSPEAAQQSFNDMRNRFSALQGRAMSIQRANVNGATYFRVRVQTASRSDANQLCSRLSSAGGNCFVTR